MPVSDSATITMPIKDFRAAEAEIDSLRDAILQMRKRGRSASTTSTENPSADGDPAWDTKALIDSALPIIQFAVGHLDPATVRNWPHVNLVAVANLIDRLCPDDANLRSLAIEFRTFSNEAARLDRFRADRYEAAAATIASATVQLSDGQNDSVEVDSSDPA